MRCGVRHPSGAAEQAEGEVMQPPLEYGREESRKSPVWFIVVSAILIGFLALWVAVIIYIAKFGFR
jgi:hypothetical protein